ncbi:DEAD/DEAH box helicase [Mycoplasmopsis edwardii]|uniref:AAA domain-containing protein n=1 Tax=Mycoplasmopsis edwardii TaxID=53558 RepID=A0ACD4PKC3_9BACT|nr:AAA domain-containing protein [Mycoplasmopsis edwardii]WBP84364.1 AAA domain-containing protein [Mycoplasmopsis edwardii]
MAIRNEKYDTILNNLLDVHSNDSSIFTKMNNQSFFDLRKVISNEQFDEIIYHDAFEISLLDGDLLSFKKDVQQAQTFDELRHVLSTKNTRKLKIDKFVETQKNLNEAKRFIINKIEHRVQDSVKQWKVLNLEATSILEETNIWPLHIGFLFTSLRVDEKVIYAPLLLKEVNFKFVNSKPYLVSEGEIKVNEKIMFFLKNNGINLHIDPDLNERKMSSFVNILRNDWDNLFSLPDDVFGEFKVKGPIEIDNENIVFHPGAVLGVFQPAGGYSRNRMKEIIEKDELESIIDVEINKNIYKEKINKHLNNPNISIFKITPSNLSQDKAIISALNQHTIIWGPPGTGKSQTIVNLITNILVYNKTAIVASQKKAALNVIKERLGSLQDFCLFILKTKNMNKSEFYKPIEKYLDQLESFDGGAQADPSPIISAKEIEYINIVNGLLTNKDIQRILYAYYQLAMSVKNPNYSNDIEFIINLPNDIIYPDKKLTNEDVVNLMLKENNAKWFTFTSKSRKVKKVAEEIKENFPVFDGSFADVVKYFWNVATSEENGRVISEINKLIELSKEIDFKQVVSNEKVIHRILSQRINDKFQRMTPEEKKEYVEFSQYIRLKKDEPYKIVKKFARIIKIIYPIIVATPDTDLSSWEQKELDYAILDESSQIFIEKGLPILYLAKVKVLAGDPEQMRPSNWFGSRSTDDSIFGRVESLLDYASSLNVIQILLDKNYRSNHAALMSFSSKHFYKSQLDVVDSNDQVNTEPIEVHEVEGAWKDSKNVEEANKAIELLKQNINKYKKIILLAFNVQQSDYINEIILDNNPELEEALNDRRLLIKNIENIQGDEADLVIATVSYDKNTKLSSTYICRPTGRNALNVAISRAKEKMIVIKTIKSWEVNLSGNFSEDMLTFKEWLRFLEKPTSEKRREVYDSFNKKLEDDSDSLFRYNKNEEYSKMEFNENSKWFKKHVYDSIEAAINNKLEYEIFEDYNVGSISIDLVVTKNKKPYKCFLFDNYDYGNKNDKYMILRDRFRFLESKKYDINVISPISWISIQNNLKNWFKPVSNGDITNFQPTSTYILNKNSLENFKDDENDDVKVEQLSEIKTVAEQNIISVLEDNNTVQSETLHDSEINLTHTQQTEGIDLGFEHSTEFSYEPSEQTNSYEINESNTQESLFSENNEVAYEEEQIEQPKEALTNTFEFNKTSSFKFDKTNTFTINDEIFGDLEGEEEVIYQKESKEPEVEREYFDFNFQEYEREVKPVVKEPEIIIEDKEEVPYDTNSVNDEIKNFLNLNSNVVYDDNELNQEVELEEENASNMYNLENQEHNQNDNEFFKVFEDKNGSTSTFVLEQETIENKIDTTKEVELTKEFSIPPFKTYENKHDLTSTWILEDDDSEWDEELDNEEDEEE